MRLSDIMGNLELSVYPQIALVIFLGVFAGVLARVLSRSAQAEFREAAVLPLNDDAGSGASKGSNT